MNEHEKQTAFLRQCLDYAESEERQELEEGIAQSLRDDRCLCRAMWLVALLMALVLVGLGYAAVLLEDFLRKVPPLVITFVSALGLAALLSLLFFAGLRVGYRCKLNVRREKCRRLALKLLESRLGSPRAKPWPEVDQAVEAVENPCEAIAPLTESVQ